MELIEMMEAFRRLCAEAVDCSLEDGEVIVMHFELARQPNVFLQQLGLKYSSRGKDAILLDTRDFPGLFFDRQHFLREVVEHPQITGADIAIMNFSEAGGLYYDCRSGKSLLNGQIDEGELFIENTRHYLYFYDYFDQSPMVEYHSRAGREFILVSPEKGKFLLGYPALPTEFPPGVSVREQFERLKNTSASADFRLYLEMQLIDMLGTFEHDQRFPKMIENMGEIIARSENSYKLFLSRFDFEKFRLGFHAKRDAYFKSIRDVIDGLLGKVVGIPVSISAAALALYNVRGEPVYLGAVLLAFVVYSLFTSFLMRLSHISIFEIESALEQDVAEISKQTGIDRSTFSQDQNKVRQKISTLQSSVVVMQLLLTILSAIVIFIYSQQAGMLQAPLAALIVLVMGLQLGIAFIGLTEPPASHAA